MNQPLPLPQFPPPLRLRPDMAPQWQSSDCGFDEAAEQLVRAHQNDGPACDLPVMDLRAWAVKPSDGHLALAPLARHHPARQLRVNAFANLATRLGAPVEFVRDQLTAPLQAAVLNYLLASGRKPLSATLRLRGDEIAAIVSNRYAPLDPAELVDTVRDALVQQGSLDQVRVRAVTTRQARGPDRHDRTPVTAL